MVSCLSCAAVGGSAYADDHDIRWAAAGHTAFDGASAGGRAGQRRGGGGRTKRCGFPAPVRGGTAKKATRFGGLKRGNGSAQASSVRRRTASSLPAAHTTSYSSARVRRRLRWKWMSAGSFRP